MAQIYSTVFISGIASSGSSLEYFVPSGFVAVVRDVALTYTGGPDTYALGAVVYDSLTTPMCSTMGLSPSGAVCYRFGLHQVLEAEDAIIVQTFDSIGWSARISGFLLSTP